MMSYHRILVALDFSDAGMRALHKACELAAQFKASLHVIHVVEFLPPLDTTFGGVSPFDVELMDKLVASARERLFAVAMERGLPEACCQVETGSPRSEILRLAEQIKADLIVLGSHGRHGLAVLLGSTASSVLHHAGCDVLAVRAESQQGPAL